MILVQFLMLTIYNTVVIKLLRERKIFLLLFLCLKLTFTITFHNYQTANKNF